MKARIKDEKISKPLLKKITWEEVKFVSVDVSHDDKIIRNFSFAFKSALVCPRYHRSRNIFARKLLSYDNIPIKTLYKENIPLDIK